MLLAKFYEELKNSPVSQSLKENLFIIFLTHFGRGAIKIFPEFNEFNVYSQKEIRYLLKKESIYLVQNNKNILVNPANLEYNLDLCENGEDEIFSFFSQFYNLFSGIEFFSNPSFEDLIFKSKLGYIRFFMENSGKTRLSLISSDDSTEKYFSSLREALKYFKTYDYS